MTPLPAASMAAAVRFSASPVMASEMSVAYTCAPRSASGAVSEPVPQPQSTTLMPSAPPSASTHASTFSTVCAWPSRMSSCTLFTSSVSP